MSFFQDPNEPPLKHRHLVCFCTSVCIHRRVLYKREIPDDVKDEVYNLRITLFLRSVRIDVATQTREGEGEQALKHAGFEKSALVVEVAPQELGEVGSGVEIFVELFELFREVDGPRHSTHNVCGGDSTLVFGVSRSRGREENWDEVVGEQADFIEDTRYGTVVVRVVLPPYLLEILQTAVAFVSESVHARLYATEGRDDVPDGWLEYSTSIHELRFAFFILYLDRVVISHATPKVMSLRLLRGREGRQSCSDASSHNRVHAVTARQLPFLPLPPASFLHCRLSSTPVLFYTNLFSRRFVFPHGFLP
jgi:hypothetical protein